VRNGATGVSGLRVVPLHVPAFARGEAALLPPLVPEPAGRWVIVREEPRGEGKPPDYPFLLRNEPFLPALRPAVTPGREVRLVLAGFNLSGDWKPEARLLDAGGREVPGARLDVADRKKDSSGAVPAERVLATFRPPADLKPGEYELRVTLPGVPQAAGLRFVVKPAEAIGPQG